MTEVIVSVEKSADIRNIVANVRQIRGVAEVEVQEKMEFEPIYGLPYTYKERMEDIRRAEENYAMGQTTTSEELKKRVAVW